MDLGQEKFKHGFRTRARPLWWPLGCLLCLGQSQLRRNRLPIMPGYWRRRTEVTRIDRPTSGAIRHRFWPSQAHTQV